MGHPLRRAHNLEESHGGRAKVFPRQVIDLVQEALQLRDAYRAGQRSQDDLYAAYEEYVDRMLDLTARPRCNEVNDIFAGHLNKYCADAWLSSDNYSSPSTTTIIPDCYRSNPASTTITFPDRLANWSCPDDPPRGTVSTPGETEAGSAGTQPAKG